MVAVFAWLSQPSLNSLTLGIPISVLGLLIRAWAAGHLAKNQQLTNTGPYAHVRNPLYIGTLLVAAGLVVAARELWIAVIFGAVFLLVYLPVIELEEQHLRKLFPAYAQYAQAVPILRPRLTPAAKGPFRWSLYKRNQEYNALLGFLAGIAILLWKAL
ncbi:MAG: isoprenylcysteine carboxylmethyltransferase family protein, partial [bacterium]|nr:isoprenylcysteine carboxylmethyltransferase family protein [bacterium]